MALRNKEKIGKWRSSKMSWAQVAPRYMTAMAALQQNRRATYPRKTVPAKLSVI
jgi:hypothetical protein